MSDDKDPTHRSTPPEPHEWGFIWEALGVAVKSWVIAKPFYEVLSNRKALFAIGAFVIWWTSPKVTAALSAFLGVGQ